MSSVAVIGAGPAGCVFAARMAQLGHHVTLIERLAFPRQRLGESLSPGVLPLLETIGARDAIESGGFLRVHQVSTAWVANEPERLDPHGRGLLVDRGRFDALLLDRARMLGVHVFQPASIEDSRYAAGTWQLRVAHGGQRFDLAADFLADATGRAGFLPGRRERQPATTIALYVYWRGSGLPRQPRIEAGADAWCWAVPLPDGLCNTLVFVDAATVRAHRGRSLTSLLERYLEQFDLFNSSVGRDQYDGSAVSALNTAAMLMSPARAIDATPYVETQSVTTGSIKIGDAALAVDPLSSSGVQRAIQTALSGAIVANTVLRQPEARQAALQFYRSSIARAAAQHARWSAAQYARVAVERGGTFWNVRAAGAESATVDDGSGRGRPGARGFENAVQLSRQLAFVDVPCIDGDFITVKQAVSHPQLDEPVAYLGGWELRPLLDDVRTGMTPLEIARAWADRVPLRSGLQITSWMLDRGVLIDVG